MASDRGQILRTGPLQDTVADIDSRRTCGSDPPDNFRSRECDRLREYLRQLVMPLRQNDTGPYETQWYGCRPSSTDAECGRHCARTMLRTARCLPGHRGNDFRSQTYVSGCSSLTGLTTLMKA
ncbi:hypothetical protein EVAR_37861_1 [Eumeta japonica]|uniref:Uncharacterized protein n=1 Tax=Eumeta variegata TaxID=151549 RepID=A0A4C1X2I5_EUMVA|nr:hypothetical protein EVAR_37861_1 [Eumeta japonica]